MFALYMRSPVLSCTITQTFKCIIVILLQVWLILQWGGAMEKDDVNIEHALFRLVGWCVHCIARCMLLFHALTHDWV